jgi:tetratricopeptide (TPR) repeat protein
VRYRLAVLFFAAAAAHADWAVFRAGPIEVYSDGNHKEARQTLATFDQLNHTVARLLGKPQVTPLWPVRIMLAREARYRTPDLEMRRNVYTGGLAPADRVPVSWLRDHARRVLREDTNPLPTSVEEGLADLLSTIEVNATKITLGTPPEPARRTRDWARLHLLCVNPEYAGRVRVFFSNLQQGASFDVAYRNAFERGEKDMEAEVERYFKAGQFTPETTGGKPIDPERDYRPRPLLDNRQEVYLADLLKGEQAQAAYRAILNSGAKNPDAYERAGLFAEAAANASESPTAWLGYGDQLTKEKQLEKAREAYRKAAQLNARWAEPHARLSSIEEKPGLAIGMLKRAAELEPRNVQRWLALAEAQLAFRDYAGAGLSWRTAERAAPTQAERLKIEARRQKFEQQRIDLQEAERKRAEEEKARELAALKQEALNKIREAELRANAGSGPSDPNRKVVEWWDDKTPKETLTGALERVDCLKGQARLAIRDSAGKLSQLLVVDPSKIVIMGGGEQSLGCGPQKPPKRLKVDYAPKSNPKLGTIGEAGFIEFTP